MCHDGQRSLERVEAEKGHVLHELTITQAPRPRGGTTYAGLSLCQKVLVAGWPCLMVTAWRHGVTAADRCMGGRSGEAFCIYESYFDFSLQRLCYGRP